MIQWMLAIWFLILLTLWNPACTSGSSQLMYCWSPAWRILSITSLAHEMSAIVWEFKDFFGIAILWDWNENWPCAVMWPVLNFPNLLAYWVQHNSLDVTAPELQRFRLKRQIFPICISWQYQFTWKGIFNCITFKAYSNATSSMKPLLFFPATKNFILLYRSHGFPHGSDGKASAYNAGDPGSIPGSGRFPGEGNGNPLQHSCLENPMDGGAW